MGYCFLREVEIKMVFILKVFCFLFAGSWRLTLKGFPSFTQWRGSPKAQNVWFRLVIGFTSRVWRSFHIKKKNNSLCTFDYSSLTLNYVPMSSNHYFLSCNYVCWPFNYCFNFVIQWLGNDVFLIRRSIIACWHSLNIQYRYPSR